MPPNQPRTAPLVPLASEAGGAGGGAASSMSPEPGFLGSQRAQRREPAARGPAHSPRSLLNARHVRRTFCSRLLPARPPARSARMHEL